MRRLALLLACATQPALAHAILVDSTPAPNAHIKPGPLAITMRYNSRIDTRRSKLTLSANDNVTTRLHVTPGPDQDLMQATANVIQGAYVIRWQVLAIDGHITRGTVPFVVDAP